MGLAGLHIALILLTLSNEAISSPSFARNQTALNVPQETDQEHDYPIDDAESDKFDDFEEQEDSDDDLPLLPPIILLDFENATANSTFETEKSKRTVNNGIGYGFERNVLLPGKYNYYFPAGKTGTTVSIEESISPFLPKTIVESVPSNGQFNPFARRRQQAVDSVSSAQNSNFQLANERQTFGLRTKLQKTNSNSYGSFLPTTPAPRKPEYRANGFSSTTSSLFLGSTEQPGYVTQYQNAYVTPSPVNYVTTPASRGSAAQNNPQTPVNPDYSSHRQRLFPDLPRYTVENGVRYENKVFWRYPDGRVTDVAPKTYVETYSGFSTPRPQTAETQSSFAVQETHTTENTVNSQGPIQFPTVLEMTSEEPSPFISGESLSSSLPQQQVYRLGYQSLLRQKRPLNYGRGGKKGNAGASAASSTRNTGFRASYRQPVSKYMVNSPNPEYVDSTEPTVKSTTAPSDLFTASASTTPKKQGLSNKNLEGYSNIQYSDLLNYNPSISQYIKNPSSILNVHPTFVQAGNSLVPVIILRVDGAPPIQPKLAPNVNLKALLQQYILEYANSLQELSRHSNYDFNESSETKSKSSFTGRNPFLGRQGHGNVRPHDPDSYKGKSSYEADEKEFSSPKYGDRMKTRQKVKSVQIIEDPRFPNYRAKN